MGIRGDHQSVRRALLRALVPGTPCPRCGRPMLPGQPLDLDHAVPRLFGGQGPRQLAHASCNRRHGAALTNARRRRGKRMRRAIGAEVFRDRSHTAIVEAVTRPGDMVEVTLLPLVDGPDAAAAIITLARRDEGLAVVVDPRSGANTLLAPLRQAGIRPVEPDLPAVILAHNTFSDVMRSGRLRHANQPALTEAVQAAELRRTAGGWAIERYKTQSADPAPAMAAELAVWAVLRPAPPEPFGVWGDGPPGEGRVKRFPGGVAGIVHGSLDD